MGRHRPADVKRGSFGAGLKEVETNRRGRGATRSRKERNTRCIPRGRSTTYPPPWALILTAPLRHAKKKGTIFRQVRGEGGGGGTPTVSADVRSRKRRRGVSLLCEAGFEDAGGEDARGE